MTKIPLALMASLLAVAFMLTSCVGGRTEPDPDKHPDKFERKMARRGIY